IGWLSSSQDEENGSRRRASAVAAASGVSVSASAAASSGSHVSWLPFVAALPWSAAASQLGRASHREPPSHRGSASWLAVPLRTSWLAVPLHTSWPASRLHTSGLAVRFHWPTASRPASPFRAAAASQPASALPAVPASQCVVSATPGSAPQPPRLPGLFCAVELHAVPAPSWPPRAGLAVCWPALACAALSAWTWEPRSAALIRSGSYASGGA